MELWMATAFWCRGEAEVAEDPRELLEEDGPEEENADEPVIAAKTVLKIRTPTQSKHTALSMEEYSPIDIVR